MGDQHIVEVDGRRIGPANSDKPAPSLQSFKNHTHGNSHMSVSHRDVITDLYAALRIAAIFVISTLFGWGLGQTL